MTSQVGEALVSKLASRDARIVVVGLGYIGLPLLLELARARFRVSGFDVDATRIGAIRCGKSLVEGVDAGELGEFVSTGKISVDPDACRLSDADVVVLAVPTPFATSGEPEMKYLNAAVADVVAHAHPGMLVLLESTSYPGTTREIAEQFSAAGFSLGEDIFIAHSPERIDPGNTAFALKNTPRVAGGVTPQCTRMACVFYKQFVNDVIAVKNADTAEVVKLLENTFRAVNIGLVNEFAVACEKLGLDIWEVVDAAATKPFGFMKFSPGPGLGGPCVPVAPRAMSWKMGHFGVPARFLDLATHANSEMPAHVARLVEDALVESKTSISGARILIAGVAYKPDIADLRGSPSLELIDILASHGSHVFYMDSHVISFRDRGRAFESLRSDASFADYDAVVLVTAHSTLDVARMVREAKLVIDTRNATSPHLATATARIVRL